MALGGAAAATLVTCQRAPVLKSLSPSDIVSLGIIGTGMRGTGIATVLQQLPDFRVDACCDILPERLQQGLSQADPKAKGYTDYRKLLEDPSLDAVVIASPLYLHHEMALAAVQSHKHIFCEKTMAYNYRQTWDLRQKAVNYDRAFQVGHQYRNTPMYHRVKEIIDRGYIGKVLHYRGQYHRNNDWRRPVEDPKHERILNWRMYREFSGGLAAELSSHQIDIVNWLVGHTPEKVIGFGGIDYWKDGRETYDNIHLTYQYPGGVKAFFSSILNNAYNGYTLTIMGTEGTILVERDKATMFSEAEALDESKVSEVVDGVSGATKKNWTQGKPIEIEFEDEGQTPTAHAFMDFALAIRNNRKPLSNEITGSESAIAIHMGNEAMERGQVVEWKDQDSIECNREEVS